MNELIDRDKVLVLILDVVNKHRTIEEVCEIIRNLPSITQDKVYSHTKTVTKWELDATAYSEYDWSNDVFRCSKCGLKLKRKYLPCECPVCYYGMSKEDFELKSRGREND